MQSEAVPTNCSHSEQIQDLKREPSNPTPTPFEVASMHLNGTPRKTWKSHLTTQFKQSNSRGIRGTSSPYSRPSSPALSFVKTDTSDVHLPGLADQSSFIKSEYERYSTPPLGGLMTMEPAVSSPQASLATSPHVAYSTSDALSNLASAAAFQEQLTDSRLHNGHHTSYTQSSHIEMLPPSSYPIEIFVGASVPQSPLGQLSAPTGLESFLTISSDRTEFSRIQPSQTPPSESTELLANLTQLSRKSVHSGQIQPPVRAVFNTSARSMLVRGHPDHPKVCLSCRCTQSPCWRPSWSQLAGQLCNSCGLRYKKTGVRCLSEACNNIPTKSEFVAMLRAARHDSYGRMTLSCLKCDGPIEVRDKS